MERFAIQRGSLILILLEDNIDWVLITLSSVCFFEALVRDVELQSTHNVLFKTSRDVMQVSTPSAQLGLVSKLVDWYQDATSVPYGHLLIDFSPTTNDQLPYCTNTGSIHSNFYVPECLNHQKSLDGEHEKSLSTLQVFQSISHNCKICLLQCYPRGSIRFFCKCIINLPKESCKAWKTLKWQNFWARFGQCLQNEQFESKERTFWCLKKTCSSITLLLLP